MVLHLQLLLQLLLKMQQLQMFLIHQYDLLDYLNNSYKGYTAVNCLDLWIIY